MNVMESIGPIPSGPITLKEFEGLPDLLRVEAIEGVPVVSPAPGIRHQAVANRLATILNSTSSDHFAAGPVDWLISEVPLNLRTPDVVLVPSSALDLVRLTTPPVLAIEVLSPESFERDVVTKRHQYHAAGLLNYWIVDPIEPSVIVYASEDGELAEKQRATGTEQLAITTPVTVTFRPADLLP